MKKLFNKDEPMTRKRIDKLETVVQRLALRTHKVTTSILTPQLISSCVRIEEGNKKEVLKKLLFKGKLNKFAVLLNAKPKRKTLIEARIESGIDGYTKILYLSGLKNIFDIELDTLDGSILTVTIFPDEGDTYDEVSTAIMWTPHVSNATIERHLLDNLEKEAIKNARV